ncbi:MAG TPA: alpha/beta fold hydrolase [Chitinophagaceae bacterium]
MEIVKNFCLAGDSARPMATDIFFNNDGRQKPIVIYAHGFNGFKDWGNFDIIARQFAEAGFVFVKFNFSHNGTSPAYPEDFVDPEAYGQNNYSRELYDLRTVIGFVADPASRFSAEVDRDKIMLLGHSRGGGVAILTAAEDERIKSLATWASVAEARTPWGSWTGSRMEEWRQSGVLYYLNARTKQQMPLDYQLYQDYEKNKARLDITEAMRSLKIPVLICHGTKDEAVPVEKAQLLKSANPSAELFLVESDHVFGRKHPWTEARLPDPMQAVVDRTIAFFSNPGKQQ